MRWYACADFKGVTYASTNSSLLSGCVLVVAVVGIIGLRGIIVS